MADHGSGSHCGWRVCTVVVVMCRLCCVVLLLAVSGCYTTTLPQHGSSVTAHSNKPVIRYVRGNDTLYSIGKKFGIDYRIIARRNHISYPYRIYVGQRLYIDRLAPGRYDPAASKIRSISQHSRKKTSGANNRKRKASKPAHKSKAKGYSSRLLWPVKGKVTSKFGRRGSRMHDGIDIAAKEGTPVHAAASGEVVYADSRLSGYGKLIIIRHGHNLFTAYGHNQRMLVKKGAKVRAGDTIGRVGHTGRASGPHLHFEVRQGSTPVNPLAYLPH
ncbi:MAG: peptidoglycan DD-metalloendopeptidase family protein [Mariprofundus sp.]